MTIIHTIQTKDGEFVPAQWSLEAAAKIQQLLADMKSEAKHVRVRK